MTSALENPIVNRYLADKDMDRIDHALGRPVWPLRKSYRDYFATRRDSDQAKDFDASPHWQKRNVCGDMAFYAVTEAGRAALADHLASLDVQHRAYEVTFEGHSTLIAAKDRNAARYKHFLNISDCLPDLTFGVFIRKASVRCAR